MDNMNEDSKLESAARRKRSLCRFLSCVLFLSLLTFVFCKVTYLYRGGKKEQIQLKGIETENCDMVYVGGSAAMLYWQPLKAWNDHGFTSYCYTTNSIAAENVLPYIKEVLRSQDPELLLIDARPFQYWTDELITVAIRHGTDAMSMWSPNRYEIIANTFRYRNIPEDADKLSYIFDIIQYHSVDELLSIQTGWEYAFEDVHCPYGGWRWEDKYIPLQHESSDTDKRHPMAESSEILLRETLEYCSKLDQKVLLVVCPYNESADHRSVYNTIGDIAAEYGIDFLNTNTLYDEMDIDFQNDFYDNNHVNVFGSEKYTQFLQEYLLEHYDLPDHRGDSEYASWDEEYILFSEESEKAKIAVGARIQAAELSAERAAQMRRETDLQKWFALENSGEYLLLAAKAGASEAPESFADRNILNQWKLAGEVEAQISVLTAGTPNYTTKADGGVEYSGETPNTYPVEFSVTAGPEGTSIQVDDETFSAGEGELHVLAFDLRNRQIADRILITTENGNLVMKRP